MQSVIEKNPNTSNAIITQEVQAQPTKVLTGSWLSEVGLGLFIVNQAIQTKILC